MNTMLLTVALVAGMGLVGSVILVIVSKRLAVKEDERLGDLVDMLPGANCGSCGYAGCEAYAHALLEGAPCNSCGPGGRDVAQQLAAYLGVDAGDVVVKRAVVACRGTADRVVLRERAGYQGAPSCRAYSTMGHLSDGCTDGCIGYGDCMAACPYGAITLNKNDVDNHKRKPFRAGRIAVTEAYRRIGQRQGTGSDAGQSS